MTPSPPRAVPRWTRACVGCPPVCHLRKEVPHEPAAPERPTLHADTPARDAGAARGPRAGQPGCPATRRGHPGGVGRGTHPHAGGAGPGAVAAALLPARERRRAGTGRCLRAGSQRPGAFRGHPTGGPAQATAASAAGTGPSTGPGPPDATHPGARPAGARARGQDRPPGRGQGPQAAPTRGPRVAWGGTLAPGSRRLAGFARGPRVRGGGPALTPRIRGPFWRGGVFLTQAIASALLPGG